MYFDLRQITRDAAINYSVSNFPTKKVNIIDSETGTLENSRQDKSVLYITFMVFAPVALISPCKFLIKKWRSR